MVKFLLEKGANPNAQGINGNTALHLAVFHEQSYEMVEYLLRCSSLNTPNHSGQTAFQRVLQGRIQYLSLFLKQMLLLPLEQQVQYLRNVRNGPYSSVFSYAAITHKEMFKELIIALDTVKDEKHLGALINQEKLLILAAQLGEVESVRKLLEYRINIHLVDGLGNNALHWAAKYGHNEVVSLLLNHDIDINATGENLNTALHYAAKRGYIEVVDQLLIGEAETTIRNKKGKNCIDLAFQSGNRLDPSNLLIKLYCKPLSVQKEALANVSSNEYDNVLSFVACSQNKYFDTVYNQINSTHFFNEGNHFLEAYKNFQQAFHKMATHYHHFPKQQDQYLHAHQAAKNLLNRCGRALVIISQSDPDTQAWMNFRKECQSAIEAAKPVLNQHRQWGKLLAKLIFAVLTLPVSLPLYVLGVFSFKTRSEQILNNMDSVFVACKP